MARCFRFYRHGIPFLFHSSTCHKLTEAITEFRQHTSFLFCIQLRSVLIDRCCLLSNSILRCRKHCILFITHQC
uniref:Uncharacterized protein n=1 Tax=Arundo donax TaxID=35708 RepID=A0A0A9G711_ARUDO